ncbi:DUF4434 domain-containing protein [Streptosporangium lutulentum]
MPSPYALTGYWLIPTVDHCTWRRQFDAIHKVGGDTVIRIGWGLQDRGVDGDGWILDKDGNLDPRYKPCEENGLPCVKAAEQELKAANPGNEVTSTFVYRTDEAFGPDLFRCPEFEKKISVGKTVFYRIVAPDDGTDDPSCENIRNVGRGYHVILIAGAEQDSLTELLDLGDRFGVKVYPALPLSPRDPAQETRASKEGIDTLTTLTRRIMQDYGARFQNRTSLAGFYQPFELQMRDMTYDGDGGEEDNPTLKVYASQHEIVDQEMPGKPILVSPYLDARKRLSFSATPQQVAKGFEALARTGVGIIAPQDSRGTGKVGLFWPDQREENVDERLRPVVGRRPTAPRITARPATTTGRWPRRGPRWSSRATTCSSGPTWRPSSRPTRTSVRRGRHQGAHRQGTARHGHRPGRAVCLQGRLLHVERLLHLRIPVPLRGDRPRLGPAHRGRRGPQGA